jgi:hypothetical protein
VVIRHSYVRSGFLSHRDEDDTERIKEIHGRSIDYLKWVLDKVRFSINRWGSKLGLQLVVLFAVQGREERMMQC